VKGCRPACEPWPVFHRANHRRPHPPPPCSSFAKDLDCSPVASRQVEKPCCHRSTAATSSCSCLSDRGMPVRTDTSETLTQYDTKAAIHTASYKKNNTSATWHSCCLLNRWQFPLSPPTRTKPTQARTKQSPLFDTHLETSMLPSSSDAQARRFHHRPARSPFLLPPSFPNQGNLPPSTDCTPRLGRIASSDHAPWCMPRRAERTTPTDVYLPYSHLSRQSLLTGESLELFMHLRP
jgi:hypothetical protein